MNGQDALAITTVVAESMSIVRAGLCALLAGEPDFAVVGETGNGAGVLDLVGQRKPDVLVLEPGLPGPAVGQLLVQARALHPALKVVLLANSQEEPAVIGLVESGAAGCFLKSDRPEELLRGIRAAAEGELPLSSSVARWLLKGLAARELPSPTDSLTEREREVLDLLTAGLSNKEIAQKLYLSVRTVEVHLRNVYAKLGVRSRLEAVTRARIRSPLGPAAEPQ